MKIIKLRNICLENFKGIKKCCVEFTNKTQISGQNASGKTTLADGFTWLLFNKDSLGNEKFQIRPLDSKGKSIDNVVISVTAVLDIDGKEVELKKIQKQNWVKKRGTDTVTMQGNINSYEIDGYPRSEAEYKKFISNLLSEDVFKILTNPQFFPSMKWKDQREMLLKFVDDVSDLDIARRDPCFDPLLSELKKAPTTEAISKKYQKELLELRTQLKESQVRIDECEKSKSNIDTAELEMQKKVLQEEISAVEEALDNSEKAYEEQRKQSDEIFQLKTKIHELEQAAYADTNATKHDLQQEIIEAKQKCNEITLKINMAKFDLESKTALVERLQSKKEQLQNDWRVEKSKRFHEYVPLEPINSDTLVCPTCGQFLPEDLKKQKISEHDEQEKANYEKYQHDLETFSQKKEENIKKIVDDGTATVQRIKDLTNEIASIKLKIKANKEDASKANEDIDDLEKKLRDLPDTPDMSGNQEYEELILLLRKHDGIKVTPDSSRFAIKEKLDCLREKLLDTERKLAGADTSAVEERIEELQSQLKNIKEKIGHAEQMNYLLEEFTRYKMQTISNQINNKFKTISWKLFDTQINGGVKECCECTINGVPYSSANNGHRIVAGLEIIQTLSELYGVNCPIFIDNAESVNDSNIPDMDAQLILLSVSDDKQLKVKGGI